jgi:tetratricopeptide (TPR) repeat protein
MRVGGMLLLCTALGLGSAMEVQAQVSADEEARQLFEQGRQAYDAGRYDEAAAAFRRAYLLSGRPALLYNIGQSELRGEHHDEALEAFEGYLRQATDDDPARRSEVEERVRQLRSMGAGGGGGAAPAPSGGFDPIGRQVGTWIALGVSIAAGATAIGLFYDGAAIYDTLQAGCGSTPAGCSDDQLSRSGIYERELATNIMWGVAGAGLLTAIVLWIAEGIYGPPPPAQTGLRLDVGPTGAVLRGTF